MVPGKSFAIISRTGQVWHPMGIPSGSARRSTAAAEIRPVAAMQVALSLTNSRLEISVIYPPILVVFPPVLLQIPAESAVRLDQLLGCIKICHAHLFSVPDKFLPATRRDIS